MPRKHRVKRPGLGTINISAPKDFAEAVKNRARSMDLSTSAHIRRLIRADLKLAEANNGAEKEAVA